MSRRLAFSGILLVAGLLALEGGARLALRVAAERVLPSAEMRRFVAESRLVFDPELGWRPATARTLDGADDVFPFRVEALPMAPPAGTLRGFALGDSQTLGAGLAPEHAWPAVAERTLRARGRSVELINAAAAGYRSAQALRLVESRLLAWQVDFLVVDCMVGDSEALPRAFDGPTTSARRALFESRLYRLLWLGVATAQGRSLGPVGRIEQPRAPEQGGGNHQALVDLARANDIAVVFVDYPFVGGPAHALAPADKLPAGVPVVPATAALNASGSSEADLFLDNNHLTTRGAALVGVTAADTLERVLYGE